MNNLHLKILLGIWQLREWVISTIKSISFSKSIETEAAKLLEPVFKRTDKLLEKSSFLKRFDWLLDMGALRSRSATVILLIFTIAAWKGIVTTENGHIGTDHSIFPLMAIVSVYNPVVAVGSALIFGAADLIQKIFNNDILGAGNWSLNHLSALFGYIIAYSAPITMGFLPGILSRTMRHIAHLFFAGRPSDQADGFPEGLNNQAFFEWLSGVLGAAFGGWFTMHEAAPPMEAPAFLMRPDPDPYCHQLEVEILKSEADNGAAGGAAGETTRPRRLS